MYNDQLNKKFSVLAARLLFEKCLMNQAFTRRNSEVSFSRNLALPMRYITAGIATIKTDFGCIHSITMVQKHHNPCSRNKVGSKDEKNYYGFNLFHILAAKIGIIKAFIQKLRKI